MNSSIVVCPYCGKKVQAPSGYDAFLCPYCKSEVSLQQTQPSPPPQPKQNYMTKRTVRTQAPVEKSAPSKTPIIIGGCVIGLLLILVIVLFSEISGIKSEGSLQKQQSVDIARALEQLKTENEKLRTDITAKISKAEEIAKQEALKTKEELEAKTKITPLGSKIKAIVQIVSPTVVVDEDGNKVESPPENGKDFNGYMLGGTSGTGEIINEKGYIVTNKHVVKQRKQKIVNGKPDGEAEEGKVVEDSEFIIYVTDADGNKPIPRYTAKLVCYAEGMLDLSVIKITKGNKNFPLPSEFDYIIFGDASKLKTTDTIVVHGYPAIGGNTMTTTRGSVSGREKLEGMSNAFIKTDARIGHGNSGGAALNTKGELIGIPTLLIRGEDIGKETAGGEMGYLINGDVVKSFLKEKDVKFYEAKE